MLALAGLGVLAGAALAIANSLADAERDAASGTATIAQALGQGTGRCASGRCWASR